MPPDQIPVATASDPPPDVVEQAKATFGHSPRREVAILAFDSLLDGHGRPEDHRLRFDHPRLSLDLHVALVGPRAQLDGSVCPRLCDRVHLHRDDADGVVSKTIVDGSFAFESVERGLVRLSLDPDDDRPAIWSDWFRL